MCDARPERVPRLTLGTSRRVTCGNKGFTLIELMVVTALLSVVSLTTYSAMAGGVKIWKRVEASVKDVDTILGWKKFKKDLVGQIHFSPIGFTGSPQEVSFPGLVTVGGGEEESHEEVGRIRYLFQGSDHSICREEITYVEAVRGGSSDCRPVLSGVKEASFKYYSAEGDLGAGWYSAWGEEIPPLAVRLELTFAGAGGKGEIAKQYTATLPY